MKKSLLIILFLFVPFFASAQEIKSQKHEKSIGFNYGVGSEFENPNYTYTNSFYKLQLYYQLTTSSERKMKYGILIQPEINFATHQLVNEYFVKDSDPDYVQKRAEYTQMKDMHEYVLGIGLTGRRALSEHFHIYFLGSVGPLIIDTETERLAKGFAFEDVAAIGFLYKTPKVIFDLRPSLRHVSNAGTQYPNSGYTCKTI